MSIRNIDVTEDVNETRFIFGNELFYGTYRKENNNDTNKASHHKTNLRSRALC